MAHWATKPLPRHWESIRCNRHLLTRPITHKPRMRWERVFCIRANVLSQIKTDLPMYDLCVKFWWKLNPFIPLTSTQVSEHVFFLYKKRIYIGWKRNTRCISYFTSASGNWHSGGLDCSKISAIRTHDLVCEWNRKLDVCGSFRGFYRTEDSLAGDMKPKAREIHFPKKFRNLPKCLHNNRKQTRV